MSYFVAERFKSIQGEGAYTGTPMAFIRFVGCSVGKAVCNACDTDFEKPMGWRGGGEISGQDLAMWAVPYQHICLTGGEPLNQDLEEIFTAFPYQQLHIETSGTIALPKALLELPMYRRHICVSPKPGFLESAVIEADEVKVIVPGLGSGSGWPTLPDAVRWERAGKTVFLQPRNDKTTLRKENMRYVLDLLKDYPQFRLSTQLHKILEEQ